MSILENQLDKAVYELRKLEMENEELELQNKRYREVLEYYGYECGYSEDGGQMARKTLESELE